MAWRVINRVSITATDLEVAVGPVEIPAQGTLEVRVKQISPLETSFFRYGLIYLKTAVGRTFGTRKFWGHLEGEDYVLGGPGFSAGHRDGFLWIEPRGVNRRILKHPASGGPWVLEISADEGVQLPQDRVQSPGFVNTADRLLSLLRVGTQGRIRF
jgi:hypothetical protein